MIKKILKYRLHWSVSLIVIMSFTLLNLYKVGVSAMASGLVYAGRVTSQIPMSVCQNYYTCSACSQCGCGSWDEDTISPIFGTNPNSTFYACKMASYQPMGTGRFMPGSIVLGYCPSNMLSTWNPTCNIWSQFQ